MVIIIAGTTVPGRYLGGKPISLQEIRRLAAQLRRPRVILSGPIIHCNLDVGPVDHIAGEIPGLTALPAADGGRFDPKAFAGGNRRPLGATGGQR